MGDYYECLIKCLNGFLCFFFHWLIVSQGTVTWTTLWIQYLCFFNLLVKLDWILWVFYGVY